MTKPRAFSQYALEAANLLAKQIKLGRKQRGWSEHNLAQRANISRATLQKIENGEMNCALGLYFEVAALVGINLFEHDQYPLTKKIEHTNDKLALLPKRIIPRNKVVDDDF